MAQISHEDGVIVAIIDRCEKYRLPRALGLKAKVDRGECLSDAELAHLSRALADSRVIKPWIDKRPDIQGIYTRMLALYQEITRKALENEERL